jgi:acyl-CoA thioester hydrolase
MRIHFFKEVGFDTKKLRSFNIGPILFKEECTFIKELSLDDEVIINIQKGKMSENGAKWQLHHEIFNANGEKCAHISISGAWMDLTARKLTIPPAALIERMKQLESGMDYVHVRKKKT